MQDLPQSHVRTISTTIEPDRTKRFSFPVISPTGFAQSPTRDESLGQSENPPLQISTLPANDNFLTAIAAQERRVLELREELQKAELELNKLKRQWAKHEANRKRDDARRITKLQPVPQSPSAAVAGTVGTESNRTPLSAETDDDANGSSAWMRMEMEKRKALLSGRKNSTRKVFSGSRHTRTLSLLSPRTQGENGEDGGQESRIELGKASLDSSRDATTVRPKLVSRSSTTSDLTTAIAESVKGGTNLPDNLDKGGLDREAIILAGKKMANEFRDGLWTFWEDIRQAAIGDEATKEAYETVTPTGAAARPYHHPERSIQGTKPSKLRPTSKDRGNKSPSSARRPGKSPARAATAAGAGASAALPDLSDPNFWDEQHATPAAKRSPSGRTHVKTPSRPTNRPSKSPSIAGNDDDGWDNWAEESNSPEKSRTSSTASDASGTNTMPSSTASGVTSPRTSGGGGGGGEGKKDPLPWPALTKLGPATLKRTASHLMREWERSLTPSPGNEQGAEAMAGEYLGLTAEAGPVEIGKKCD